MSLREPTQSVPAGRFCGRNSTIFNAGSGSLNEPLTILIRQELYLWINGRTECGRGKSIVQRSTVFVMHSVVVALFLKLQDPDPTSLKFQLFQSIKRKTR